MTDTAWHMPKFECPTCGHVWQTDRIDDAPFRPFCSRRCKLIDLGRWLDGTYAISDPIDPTRLPDDDADGGDEPQ